MKMSKKTKAIVDYDESFAKLDIRVGETMELLNKETIESIYEKATDILATVGVEFDLGSAVKMFKKTVQK